MDYQHYKKRISALRDFQGAARGKTKPEILKMFLNYVITENDICDEGSLYVVSEDGATLLPYEVHFNLPGGGQTDDAPSFSGEGLAWKCYELRKMQKMNGPAQRPEYKFTEQDPVSVQNIVCLPIFQPTGRRSLRVIGVVSFHNNDTERTFEPEDIDIIEVYVDQLSYALEASRSPWHPSKRIFVVHGHDPALLKALTDSLRLYGVSKGNISVLKRMTGGNKTILEHLEEQVRDCFAGFVLMSPDDMGGERQSAQDRYRPRARQNVIFEAGMLCEKWRSGGFVRFVVKLDPESNDLEYPSDINGLKVITFDENTFEEQIAAVLKAWGFAPPKDRD